jgi:hypothetical protein
VFREDDFLPRDRALELIRASRDVVIDHEGELELVHGSRLEALPQVLGRRLVGSEEYTRRRTRKTVYIAELWRHLDRELVVLVEGPPAPRVADSNVCRSLQRFCEANIA